MIKKNIILISILIILTSSVNAGIFDFITGKVTSEECIGPYHIFTQDGKCVWSCSYGTTPASPNDITTECICKEGYVENGLDKYGRITCKFDSVDSVDNIPCTDSDGGKDYYNRGQAKGLKSPTYVPGGYEKGVIYGSNSDKWGYIIDNSLPHSIYNDACMDSDILVETFCADNKVTSLGIKCPNGCKEGVCLEEKPEINIKTCEDSDGIDFSTKGTVKFTSSINGGSGSLIDRCTGVGEGVTENICGEDKCGYQVGYKTSKRENKEFLLTYVNGATYNDCDKKGVDRIYNYDCALEGKICVDGACVNQEEDVICIESDGGSYQYIRGNVTLYQGGNTLNSSTDYCSDNTYLIEYVCQPNWYFPLNPINCKNGCKDGACVKEEKEPVPQTIYTCKDYEIEKNSFIRGSIYYTESFDENGDGITKYNLSDECVSEIKEYSLNGVLQYKYDSQGNIYPKDYNKDQGKSLYELSCVYDNGQYKSFREIIHCEYGCVDGACLNESKQENSCQSDCTINSGILDKNCNGINGCVFPINSEIDCEGLVLNQIYENNEVKCSGNTIYKEYKCKQELDGKITPTIFALEICSQGCVQGECIINEINDTFVNDSIIGPTDNITEIINDTIIIPPTIINETEERCVDSDDGIEAYISGELIWKGKEVFLDKCVGNNMLQEHFCEGDNKYVNIIKCENECYEGACTINLESSLENNNEPSLKNGKKDEIVKDKKEISTCMGCKIGLICYVSGYRVKSNYCDFESGKFIKQKKEGSCDNNYECESDICNNNTCQYIKAQIDEDKNFLEKVVDAIKNFIPFIGEDKKEIVNESIVKNENKNADKPPSNSNSKDLEIEDVEDTKKEKEKSNKK